MLKSVLYFGRKDCVYSNKIREHLKKNSENFYYIESRFFGEKLKIKKLKNVNFDYIFCFRSFYILKSNLINKCKKAPINFHPGPPQYRGIGCINYALYNNAKYYGCTAHIMNELIDSGKILDVRKFKLRSNDNIEKSLKKTYELMVEQALYVINSLIVNDKNLKILIKKNKHEKWSKKILKKKDLDKFYEIDTNLSKENLKRKIRATNTSNFKPYIFLHKKKFIFNEQKKDVIKKIIIFGSGVHAKVVLSEIVKIDRYDVIGFVDDTKKIGTIIDNHKDKTYSIISDIKGVKQFINKNIMGIIGVGSNFIRKNISKKIEKIYKDFNWAKIVSSNSTLNGNVKIGKGSIIISGSVINTGTIIGNHCLINTSSSIDHDNIFNNFSSTGPGVTTGGNVELGNCSHLGINSTIRHNISIKENTIIGAKSLVLKNCEKNSVYYGSPAKKIRDRKYNSEYL